MKDSFKENIIHSLIQFLPPLSETINEILALTKKSDKKRNKEMLGRMAELNELMRELLKISAEGVEFLKKEKNDNVIKESAKIYEVFFNMVEHLYTSNDILIYLIATEAGTEQLAIKTREKEVLKQGKQYNIESAIDYLYRGSKELSDLVDLLV